MAFHAGAFLKKRPHESLVCSECTAATWRATPPSPVLFFFHLWCCALHDPERAERAVHYPPQHTHTTTTTPPPRLPLFISLLLSPVMSLSRCESLGYQRSASDRKRVIKKLSCFSPPLLLSFLLPFSLRDEDSCCSQRHFSSSSPSSLLPLHIISLPFALLSWMAGSHRCVTIITRKLGRGKKK